MVGHKKGEDMKLKIPLVVVAAAGAIVFFFPRQAGRPDRLTF